MDKFTGFSLNLTILVDVSIALVHVSIALVDVPIALVDVFVALVDVSVAFVDVSVAFVDILLRDVFTTATILTDLCHFIQKGYIILSLGMLIKENITLLELITIIILNHSNLNIINKLLKISMKVTTKFDDFLFDMNQLDEISINFIGSL